MRHPNTVYTGERVMDGRGRFTGRAVLVNGERLALPEKFRMSGGFEWGYGGAGPAQLSLALILDATGDELLAVSCYTWFKWAKVSCWGQTWRITAGEIRQWVEQCQREQYPDESPVCGADVVRRCRVCSCTDFDCRQCIAVTGHPCQWVEGEPDLCTRCADAEDASLLVEMNGGAE